jgi:soluble lytic murein transglycosylase-like protein
MEARSFASVKESLQAQLDTLRNENFYLRQRAGPLPQQEAALATPEATPASPLAVPHTPASGGAQSHSRSLELDMVDLRAALKAAQAEVQFLQKEVVSRKSDVTHYEVMATEFEANWKAAEERLKTERQHSEVRAAPDCSGSIVSFQGGCLLHL